MGKIADIQRAQGNFEKAIETARDLQLPALQKLGDQRGLLVGQACLALSYLARNAVGDLQEAKALLRAAWADAVQMKIPEADQIRAIQRRHGLE
jgi:2-hydroxychromene-2-carboxylate isomerase